MTHQAQAPQPNAPVTPHLLYGEQEEDLRAAVRALLTDRCPPSAVLRHIESGRSFDAELWRTLAADIGAVGLLIPEEFGGQGAGAREAAVVLEELGRALAPVPYLTSAVIATEALLGCAGAGIEAATRSATGGAAPAPGARATPTDPTVTAPTDAATARELLAELAAGQRIAVIAAPLTTAPGAHRGAVRADARGLLTGAVNSVADAAVADVLLVPASGPGGGELYAVCAGGRAPGVRTEPITPLDLTRTLAKVSFDGAPARRVAGPGAADAALARALLTGAGLLASEQLGLAEWCLAETVRHTKERHQFGRPVGSFQALKHRMATLWLDLVSARATARAAADTLATGAADAPVAVAVAQAHGARAAVRAAHECVQLHGGIGMTWEHPAHLYLKRAKSDELALGTPGRHQEALAHLVDLPAPGA